MMMAGARTKTGLSAKGGIQSSLMKILIMSATTWQQAEGPDAVGAVAVLPQGEQPALDPDEARGDGEGHDQDREDGDEGVEASSWD